MRKIHTLFLALLLAGQLAAQASESAKTILFLIPFYSTQYDEAALLDITTSESVNTVNSFQLMGFWAGAQIALDEYDKRDVPLKVVVRDVSNSESKLRSIMENDALMKEVDLIVGPFFTKLFTIAAGYARQYKIPIVNPFTNRTDILQNNNYVFKPVSSLESRPAMVAYMSDKHINSQIILYSDSSAKNKEYHAYVNYFKANNVAYKVVNPSSSLVSALKNDKFNVVVVLNQDDEAKMLMITRDLIYKANLNNLLLVVPESWMGSKTFDIEYYSKLNLHYFSDYYIDATSEQTMLFVHKYVEKFSAPPTTDNFAYQGYDMVRFFVEYLLNGNDLDRVKMVPVAQTFSFDKTDGGGYENVNVQFLEVKENQVVPVGF